MGAVGEPHAASTRAVPEGPVGQRRNVWDMRDAA